MLVTVFRSRLRPEARAEYTVWADRMHELAATMPGFVSQKTFVAEDGERVTIAEFESEEAQRAWKSAPAHVEAQRRGREDFYLEYRIQVCEVQRSYDFSRDDGSLG